MIAKQGKIILGSTNYLTLYNMLFHSSLTPLVLFHAYFKRKKQITKRLRLNFKDEHSPCHYLAKENRLIQADFVGVEYGHKNNTVNSRNY